MKHHGLIRTSIRKMLEQNQPRKAYARATTRLGKPKISFRVAWLSVFSTSQIKPFAVRQAFPTQTQQLEGVDQQQCHRDQGMRCCTFVRALQPPAETARERWSTCVRHALKGVLFFHI